ncbi:hypothetical protein Tco_1134904 [Tanacetum coccineum]
MSRAIDRCVSTTHRWDCAGIASQGRVKPILGRYQWTLDLLLMLCISLCSHHTQVSYSLVKNYDRVQLGHDSLRHLRLVRHTGARTDNRSLTRTTDDERWSVKSYSHGHVRVREDVTQTSYRDSIESGGQELRQEWCRDIDYTQRDNSIVEIRHLEDMGDELRMSDRVNRMQWGWVRSDENDEQTDGVRWLIDDVVCFWQSEWYPERWRVGILVVLGGIADGATLIWSELTDESSQTGLDCTRQRKLDIALRNTLDQRGTISGCIGHTAVGGRESVILEWNQRTEECVSYVTGLSNNHATGVRVTARGDRRGVKRCGGSGVEKKIYWLKGSGFVEVSGGLVL